MAKKPKNPRAPLPTTPPSKENTQEIPKGKWERVKEYWVEILVTGVLGGLLVGAILLWLGEFRGHEETKGKLAREEEAKREVSTERDQLKNELARLTQENADLKRKSPMLALFTHRSKIVTTYDLHKEAGRQLVHGKCPQPPCFLFTLGEIHKGTDGDLRTQLLLGGEWEGWPKSSPQAIAFALPLKRGCYVTFEVPTYDITFVIEEDRVSDLRAAIGISLASSPRVRRGLEVDGAHCPKD